MLGELTELIHRVTAEAEGEGLWPAGLAVAVPGLVARDARTVVRAPNLGWLDTDLGPLLPEKLPLTVANEANFGALAELWLGEDTPRDFLHVSAEIGIGAAVVVDGRVLHGNRGSRANWAMCRCGPTARRAPAAAGAAWSSTRARRRCCARPASNPARTGSACSRAAPNRATPPYDAPCTTRARPWASP